MDNLTADLEAMRLAVEKVSSKNGNSTEDKSTEASSSAKPTGSDGHHTFSAKIGNIAVYYSVIKKPVYTFLWVGTGAATLTNLAVSMPTRYDRGGLPASTQILGSADHTHSGALASKLAKRTGNPYYVSYNMPDMDARLVQQVDEKLFEEISVHPERF